MKYILILLILMNISCQSTKKSSELLPINDEPLVVYSKGRCFGKCQVYDLWIFNNGAVYYKGIDHVTIKGGVKSQLQRKELKVLKSLLNTKNLDQIEFRKIKDLPVTKLIYKGKEFKYYSSKSNGSLKKLNATLENIVAQISADHTSKEG